MTATALEFVWYMISKTVNFLFSAQIVPGVTIGSLFVALFVFGVLLNTLLRVPYKFRPPSYTDTTSRRDQYDSKGNLKGYSISRSRSKSHL